MSLPRLIATLLAPAALLTACGTPAGMGPAAMGPTAPLAAPVAVAAAPTGATLSVRTGFRAFNGRKLLETVEPWDKDDVVHLVINLRYPEGGDVVQSADLYNEVGDFEKLYAFKNLKNDTQYVVEATAYSDESEDEGAIIGTSEAYPVNVGTDTQLEAVTITVQLQNRTFSANTGNGGIQFEPGSLDHEGEESIEPASIILVPPNAP